MPLPLIPAAIALGSAAVKWGPAALSLLSNANTTSRNLLPKLSETCDVIVYGNPQCKRQDLYRLAMGMLWGKIQRRDLLRALPPPGVLMMEYSLEGNWLRLYMEQVTPYTAGLFGNLNKRRDIELFTGPQDDSLTAGVWAFTSALPGAPGGGISSIFNSITGRNTVAAGVGPVNGFENRVVLTSAHTYVDKSGQTKVSRSPSPPGDGISRGVNPVASDPVVKSLNPDNISWLAHYLLWSPLSEPCSTTGMIRVANVDPGTIPPPRTPSRSYEAVPELPPPPATTLPKPPEVPSNFPFFIPGLVTGQIQTAALSIAAGATDAILRGNK